MTMFQASETLLTPTTLLWLASSGIAAALLLGGMSRRRVGLTETLRNFVARRGVDSGAGEGDTRDEGSA